MGANKKLVTKLLISFHRVVERASVPAGVGVVQQLDMVAAHGLAIALVLAGSVLITLLVTVLSFVAAARLLSLWVSR